MDTAGRVTVNLSGDVPVIALVGEFDIANECDLRNALAAVANGHRARVALDLSRTTFLDSTALRVLAVTWREGIDLSVRGATGEARLALEVSGLLCYLREDG